MGFYRVTHRDGAFIARVMASLPENALGAIFDSFPPPVYKTDGRILNRCAVSQFGDYVINSDPNTRTQDFIVEDELRLIDAEIDRQVFGNEITIEAPDKPIRKTDHTPVPAYSANDADAEKAWDHAMKQLCKKTPQDFVELCQHGPYIATSPNSCAVGLYELGGVTASTKAHALSLAALKTVADISQFNP